MKKLKNMKSFSRLPDNIIKFLFNHQYQLNKVTGKYKEYIIENKVNIFNISEYQQKEQLVFCYPGLTYTEEEIIDRYCKYIHSLYPVNRCTLPRGYVDHSTNMVIGIAPGKSKLSFGESNWLFGPSSKILHEMLSFDYRWYFTNVSKESFSNNKYDESIICKYYSLILKELWFFNKSKIIFLGNYDIYDKLIYDLSLSDRSLKIKHPAYFTYRGKRGIDKEQAKIKEFVLV